ncbi:F-box protein At5g06550 [Arabidopsis thaliana] [Rhizoctonia solani]|uniref:F-box protein At5g06550 [Arabidopsis thaliana] n=1 Tax=Rhizoctonia solani TaxID=456999 RepID=A0A0K6G153_9AGAM|nr:F-box protein At5g06550 [Arabidopsis thaliana] [Rhizoctonia solani]
MGMDYTPPSFLSEDLFQLMGEKRPDYRWLIVGPAKSGSTFHKDPNATSAWNAVITGSKGWVMFPPDICPPGVYVSPDEAEVTSPLSLAEWFMSYFDAAWSEYGRGTGKMRIGVCRAGEVVYVPSGWWHLVVNLEPSVAVTQNFASEHELTNVLQFMRDKPDQTSGWSEDIACNDLYEIFCDVLRKERPEVLERALAALNKAPRKSSGEQQYVWDQVKKSTESEGNCGFSFGFDVEGGDEEE